MKNPISYLFFILILIPFTASAVFPKSKIETNKLILNVEENGHWSLKSKTSNISLENISWLGDDWKYEVSGVQDNANTYLGKYKSISITATRPQSLTHILHIAVSMENSDITLRHEMFNKADEFIELDSTVSFVTNNARIGGTPDHWMNVGTNSLTNTGSKLICMANESSYYNVYNIVTNEQLGECIFIGALTTKKGFGNYQFSKADGHNKMGIKHEVVYNVTFPPGEHIYGEEILLQFGNSGGHSALEHFGDMVALVNNINIKEQHPIIPGNRQNELIFNTYAIFGSDAITPGEHDTPENFQRAISTASKAIYETYHLDRYGLRVQEYEQEKGFTGVFWWSSGVYHQGVDHSSLWNNIPKGTYPPECYYLPPHHDRLDFSNPKTLQIEKERIAKTFEPQKDKYNSNILDFNTTWGKFKGQYDKFQSAVETYRNGIQIWEDWRKKYSPQSVLWTFMSNFSWQYGLGHLVKVNRDVPQAYYFWRNRLWFYEAIRSEAPYRYPFNGRVWWNNLDMFHVKSMGFTYDMAKTQASYFAVFGNKYDLSESFLEPMEPDRLDIIKRAFPVTMDSKAYPVDMFKRQPVKVYNLPIHRNFGDWNIVGVLNFIKQDSVFRDTLTAKQLRLDPNKKYHVFEFWSQKYLGTFQNTFVTRPINPVNCDVYSIVEYKPHPVLLSTNRHIRQMAVDIVDVNWNENTKVLSGISKSILDDVYELRVFVPEKYSFAKAGNIPAGAKISFKEHILRIKWTNRDSKDVHWKLFFK